MRTTIWIAAATAILLTIGPAYFHGFRNFRWDVDDEVVQLSARLKEFPEELGKWKMMESMKLGKVELDMLVPFEYIARTYVQGEYHANLVILLGPTGPTAEHTPDICFDSQEYSQIEKRKAIPIDPTNGRDSTFWLAKFERKGLDKSFIASWYAWTVDGCCRASSNPQFAFANNRFLVKVQVDFFSSQRDTVENETEAKDFVKIVEKSLTEHLF